MNDLADLAPLVVVGVAEGDERIGQTVASRPDPNYPDQLHRIRLSIENVLRGETRDRTIFVYYFTLAGGHDGPPPLHFGSEPSRRILWLRIDQGVYRIACDRVNCTIPVMSGAHPRYKVDPRQPLDRAMIDLLLTRGEGKVNDHDFARGILRDPWRPGLEEYAVDQLEHLALTETPEVRQAACQMLWGHSRPGPKERLWTRAEEALQSARCKCEMTPSRIVCE